MNFQFLPDFSGKNFPKNKKLYRAWTLGTRVGIEGAGVRNGGSAPGLF